MPFFVQRIIKMSKVNKVKMYFFQWHSFGFDIYEHILHKFWSDGARELSLSSKDASYKVVTGSICFQFVLAFGDEGRMRHVFFSSFIFLVEKRAFDHQCQL